MITDPALLQQVLRDVRCACAMTLDGAEQADTAIAELTRLTEELERLVDLRRREAEKIKADLREGRISRDEARQRANEYASAEPIEAQRARIDALRRSAATFMDADERSFDIRRLETALVNISSYLRATGNLKVLRTVDDDAIYDLLAGRRGVEPIDTVQLMGCLGADSDVKLFLSALTSDPDFLVNAFVNNI